MGLQALAVLVDSGEYTVAFAHLVSSLVPSTDRLQYLHAFPVPILQAIGAGKETAGLQDQKCIMITEPVRE